MRNVRYTHTHALFTQYLIVGQTVNMNPRDHASTFAKGLAVLSCFQDGTRDLMMADIADLTGFDRAVARRLCLTLEAEGYLTRNGRFLRLTPKILALAGGYLSAEGIGRSVQPVLNQCAETLKGEVALAVLNGNQAMYVARSAVGSARMSLGFSVGSTLPLLPTAVGHMLLASCEAAEREAVIGSCKVKAYTPTTDLQPSSIRARIMDAGKQGYAYLSGEFEAGAAGLAVPAAAISNGPSVLATTASAKSLADPNTRDRVLEALFQAAHVLRQR